MGDRSDDEPTGTRGRDAVADGAMTGVLRATRVAGSVGVLAPIQRTAEGIAADGYPTVVAGLADGLLADDTFHDAADLADGTGIEQMLRQPQQRWDAAPHAAAALAWKSYSYWTALPAVLGYLSARRIPLAAASNMSYRYCTQSPWLTVGFRRAAVAVLPDDPLAGAPGTVVVDDDAELLVTLRNWLVDLHLEPILSRIRDHVHIGRRTLWGSLASGVAHAVQYGAPVAGADPVAATRRLVDGLGVGDLVAVDGTDDGGLAIRRRTCCLAFTVDGLGTCRSCCLPAESRD